MNKTFNELSIQLIEGIKRNDILLFYLVLYIKQFII